MTKLKICFVEGCGKVATATVFCQMHYRRKKLYGDPNTVMRVQRRSSESSKIILHETYAEVELTQGKFAIIDLIDVPKISGMNWHYSVTTGYAYSNKAGTSMHQLLLGRAPAGCVTDHEDRDKLNNRRGNISHKTYLGNNQNSDRVMQSAGIAFHKLSGKYQAWINFKGRQLYLGLFMSEGHAEEANRQARELANNHTDYNQLKYAWKLMRRQRADDKALKKDD